MRWLILASLALSGCVLLGGSDERVTAPGSELDLVESEAVVDFYATVQSFYDRMALRRFNTLATYQDRRLREFFHDEAAFADYYAELSNDLTNANFDRNRPLGLDLTELLVEGPGRARARVRIVGENGLPLRFWESVIEREDRWERRGGAWFVIPGKL